MNIFDQPYYPLAYFNYEIYVHCPRCRGLGVVTSHKEDHLYDRNKRAKFHCYSCGHVAGSPAEWLGYYVGSIGLKRCKYCGSPICKKFPVTKTLYKEGLASCAICHQEAQYEISWCTYRSGLPADPFFGLELYYQKTVKKGNLWIYNLEHAAYLRAYLNATIRDRGATSLHTLVARLPEFIKSRKNREAITKQLDEFTNQIKKKVAGSSPNYQA